MRDSATSEQRRDTKSKRMERPCLARMNVNIETEGTVKVWYVIGHTGHDPSLKESHFLPLPALCKKKMNVYVYEYIFLYKRSIDGHYNNTNK